MLGPVVLKNPLDILHEGDQVNIADQEKDLDQTIDEMEKDALNTEFAPEKVPKYPVR